jgi:hypothetical protein
MKEDGRLPLQAVEDLPGLVMGEEVVIEEVNRLEGSRARDQLFR